MIWSDGGQYDCRMLFNWNEILCYSAVAVALPDDSDVVFLRIGFGLLL